MKSDDILTDIDGNKYNTIVIGNQVWATENLRTTRFKDGESIKLIEFDSEWKESNYFGLESGFELNGQRKHNIAKLFCFYDNNKDEYFKNKYGALYNGAAVHSKKLAPEGWRIPNRDDWYNLFEFINKGEKFIVIFFPAGIINDADQRKVFLTT